MASDWAWRDRAPDAVEIDGDYTTEIHKDLSPGEFGPMHASPVQELAIFRARMVDDQNREGILLGFAVPCHNCGEQRPHNAELPLLMVDPGQARKIVEALTAHVEAIEAAEAGNG